MVEIGEEALVKEERWPKAIPTVTLAPIFRQWWAADSIS
jgi:hypothetical protein